MKDEKYFKISKDLLIGIAIIAIIALVVIGVNSYNDYKDEMGNQTLAFQRSQLDLLRLLEESETYLINYSIEGMHSTLQNNLRVRINEDARRWRDSIEYDSFVKEADYYVYENGIDDILDELYIYVNQFETDRYPNSEENLGYMNNLLLLIQELRQIVEEHKMDLFVLEKSESNQKERISIYLKLQSPVFEKNTWTITRNDLGDIVDERIKSIVDEKFKNQLSSEELRKIAYNFLKVDEEDLTFDEVKESGGGNKNYHGMFLKEVQFESNKNEITLFMNGTIEEIRSEDEIRSKIVWDSDEVEVITDEEVDGIIKLAEDYLKRHGINGFNFKSIPHLRDNTIILNFSPEGPDYYFNRYESIQMEYTKLHGYQLYSVNMPDPIISKISDSFGYESAYQKKDELMALIEPYYNVISSKLEVKNYSEGNMRYYWIFEARVENETYYIYVETDTGEIVSYRTKQW
ncbi:MAG: hypothetical protein KAH05_08030 [Clostridiales bacterium]|nr:hypothetical protein [Clostridiales bacterium]